MQFKSKRAQKKSAIRNKQRDVEDSSQRASSSKSPGHPSAVIAFGLVLQELRQRKQLSQEAVASLVDLEVEEVADIERGVREPNLVMLFKLAAALDTEPSELIARMERKLQ